MRIKFFYINKQKMARTNGDALSIQGIAVARTAPTNGQWLIYNSTTMQYEPWTVWGGGWSWDMTKVVYDPNTIEGDSFDMENMVEWATNKILTATEKTKIGHISVTQAVDLDQMESDIASLDQVVILKWTWDASVGTFPWWGTAQSGHSYIVSVWWTIDSQTFVANDRIVSILDNASTWTYSWNWHKLDYTDQVLSVAGKTGAVTLDHGDITDFDTELAGKTNTTPFTPTADYHPATKKYVDDNAGWWSSAKPRSQRMTWLFPDSNIDPETDLTWNDWHTVSCIWYELNSSGALVKRDDSSHWSNFYYTSANAKTVRQNCTIALVNVSSGNTTWMNTLCSSSSNRATAITELIDFCNDNQFDGVDLDWEDFWSWTSTHYANWKIFVRELGDALHAEWLLLSIEAPPIWNDSSWSSPPAWATANSQWYYEFTYEDINDLPVDQMVIMSYDYQYDYSAGEPNQPLEWLRDILEWARLKINERKVKIVAWIPVAWYYGATWGYSITNSTYDYLSAQTGFGSATRDTDSGEIIWANAWTSYALIDDTAVQQKVAICEETGVYAQAYWHLWDNLYWWNDLTNLNFDQHWNPRTPELIKTVTIEDPTSSEDIWLLFTRRKIKILQINDVVVWSSTPSVTWNLVFDSDRSAAWTDVFSSNRATTSTTGAETTTFNNDTIDAWSWVWLETSAQSWTVDELSISITYKEVWQ